MKKIVSLIAMAILLTAEVCAQQYPNQTPSRDTLPCGQRQRYHYYTSWYDTTYFHYSPETFRRYPEYGNIVGFGDQTSLYYPELIAYQQFAPRPIRIKGLWAMVSSRTYDASLHVLDTNRLPEYLYLYVRDTSKPIPTVGKPSDFLIRVATVRWDTAHPKMMCLPQAAYGQLGKYYCHVYGALLDTVHTIQGEFWIGGTANSNTGSRWDGTEGNFVCDHWPTLYKGYNFRPWPYGPDPYGHNCWSDDKQPDGPWKDFEEQSCYGPFGAILDEEQYYVEVATADMSQGFARPTAYYPAGSYQTITATSRSCHRFSHWNDGVTDNPRTILVTQDTSFTAYFDTVTVHDISVRSNDTALGYAHLARYRNNFTSEQLVWEGEDNVYWWLSSDTVYCEGDSAIFKAYARPGAYFWGWSDSVRDNPRTLTVTQDTHLTAIFSTEMPPPYVPPCPRVYKTLVLVEDTGQVRLMWVWGARSKHRRWEVAWGLAGTPPDSCQILPCSTYERVIGNLEPGVRYVAYVRALCLNTNDDTEYYSEWSDSVSIYFPEFTNRYTVSVAADYAERGRVYGGGEYDEGAEAMLTATAWNPYRFLQWDDGDTTNPRYVVVTQDTSFTALFVTREGIDTANSLGSTFLLLPNPASGSVRCVIDDKPFQGGTLTVTDASGREMLHSELPPLTTSHTIMLTAYPKGVYFVTLTTAVGSSTQKLTVK